MNRFLALHRKGGWVLVGILALTMVVAGANRAGFNDGERSCKDSVKGLSEVLEAERQRNKALSTMLDASLEKTSKELRR